MGKDSKNLLQIEGDKYGGLSVAMRTVVIYVAGPETAGQMYVMYIHILYMDVSIPR